MVLFDHSLKLLEATFPPALVKRALCFLWCARGGLQEEELLRLVHDTEGAGNSQVPAAA